MNSLPKNINLTWDWTSFSDAAYLRRSADTLKQDGKYTVASLLEDIARAIDRQRPIEVGDSVTIGAGLGGSIWRVAAIEGTEAWLHNGTLRASRQLSELRRA